MFSFHRLAKNKQYDRKPLVTIPHHLFRKKAASKLELKSPKGD